MTNAADADILWSRAVEMAKQGQMDMAFLNFRMLADTYPDVPQNPAAQFNVGEYYFLQNNFPLAVKEFKSLFIQHSKQKESLMALVYLYKMAQSIGDENSMKSYQKKIISLHQNTFIFQDHKSFEYISGLQHKYKFVFTINGIEVLMDGHLFTRVPS